MSENKEVFENGTVKISDEVVTIIAGIATMEVQGVHSMHTGIVEGFSNFFTKNNYSKGIKVEINNENVVLDIFINVNYGCKINKVAEEIQDTVKKEVETMTDLNVSQVNIHVQNIITEKSEKNDKNEKNDKTENIEEK